MLLRACERGQVEQAPEEKTDEDEIVRQTVEHRKDNHGEEQAPLTGFLLWTSSLCFRTLSTALSSTASNVTPIDPRCAFVALGHLVAS
jgi:hypothetical protein